MVCLKNSTLLNAAMCGLLKVAVVVLGSVHLSVNAQTVGAIGIGDFSYSAPELQGQSKAAVISELNDSVSAALLRTRKFAVLDREQLGKRFTRQGLNLQGFYNKTYTGNELLQAGLDYILTVDVVQYGLFEQQRGQANNVTGLVELDFKLLGVADATQDTNATASAQVSVRVPSGDTPDVSNIMRSASVKAVDQLVDRMIAELHPIRIISINEDSVITLSYGQGILEAGDTVLIYPQDQDIQLNADGEPVGDAIATLQVTNAKKKFATAQAIDGFVRLERGQKGQRLLSAAN